MGDVGCHGGHHGGKEPLILLSPLSLRLQHLQLGRGGPGHGTGGVAATDQLAGQYSQHFKGLDGSSLTRFQALDYTRHVLGASEVLVGRLDIFHAGSAEF